MKGFPIDLFIIAIAALGIAVSVNILFKRVGIPVIIGYVTTGTLIVYAFDLTSLAHSSTLSHIAEFGIVFLMFMIGLEFSFDKIKAMRQEVLLFGTLQIVCSWILFYLLAHFLFGMERKIALIVSAAFSLSSTAIVLKSFNETRETHTGYGRNALGILIMQDIAVIPILLLISLLANKDAQLGELLLHTLLSAIAVLFILFVPGKKAAEVILKLAADTRMDEIFVGTILFLVLGASALAGYFGFSYSLGAFIAGMIIAGTRYKYQAEADLSHFRDLLLGLFFITVGMQVDLEYLAGHFFRILWILLAVMVLKALVIFAVIRLFRSAKVAFKTALSLAQVGEFSFAIFALSQSNGLLDRDTHQLLVLTVIFSMILTPFLLKNLRSISGILIREAEPPAPATNRRIGLNNHIVVCGYGSFGKEVVSYLKRYDINYLAVDYNMAQVEEGIRAGENVQFGNIAQKAILEKLNLEECVAVVVAVDDTRKIRVICESILQKAPHCHIIAKVTTKAEEEELEELEIYRVVNEKHEIARLLGQAAISCEYERLRG